MYQGWSLILVPTLASPPRSVVVEESKRDFFFRLYLNILARTVNHTENVLDQLSDPDGPWMVRMARVGCFFLVALFVESP